jgi:hypothetical protein
MPQVSFMRGKGKHVLKDFNSSASLEKEWTSAVTRKYPVKPKYFGYSTAQLRKDSLKRDHLSWSFPSFITEQNIYSNLYFP